MNQREETIKNWIQKACDANNAGYIAQHISFTFNKRFTMRFGDACLQTRQIRISEPLWDRATPKQKYELIIHETCHIIAGILYRTSHPRTW